MQYLINCKLVVSSEINGNKDCVIINGKGYYKNEKDVITIYFNSDDSKYKYVYSNDCLLVNCNDSEYKFKVGEYALGKIKNGDYIFEITTFATKIEIKDNLIVLDYNLSQQGTIIGKYNSELSFY